MACRHKVLAEQYLHHQEEYLHNLVSRDDASLSILQFARVEFTRLLDNWSLCQREVERYTDVLNSSTLVAYAHSYKRQKEETLIMFDNHILSKSRPVPTASNIQNDNANDSSEVELYTTANLPVTSSVNNVPMHSTPYAGESRRPQVSFPPSNCMSDLHISPRCTVSPITHNATFTPLTSDLPKHTGEKNLSVC